MTRPPPPHRRSRRRPARRGGRGLAGALLGLLAVVALGTLAGWLVLRASLPPLDGRLRGPGLLAPVAVERDARGVPTLRAASRGDLAWATGYLHAQDRFFQMDLARRLAAGELAELLGARLVPQDRRARLFRLRPVARTVVSAASPEERALLAAYAQGVNAGLAGLGSRPWEYWLLRTRPAPWREEDSALVGLSIWWQLQYGDLERARVRAAVGRALLAAGSKNPDAVLRFLYPRGTSWDAPLRAASAAAAPPADPPVPPPEALDLRLRGAPVGVQIMSQVVPAPSRPGDDAGRGAGSNNWALAGSRTVNGAALVANDMHLGLGVPAIWYPLRLVVAPPPGGGRALNLAGVSLPGVPTLIAGSNGALAWGFTNSYGNWLDVTRMRCPQTGELERPDGVREPITRFSETIAVKDGASEVLEVDAAPSGTLLAKPRTPAPGADAPVCDVVAWLADVPAATNFSMLGLERAGGVTDALAIAASLGIPAQNLVAGDRDGHIGWALAGRIPDDRGQPEFLRNTGLLPWRDRTTQPALADPPGGEVWTANARVVEGADEAIVGGNRAALGAGYDLGARATQVRDQLRSLAAPARPADMLRIQLDDRALFLARWQRLLLALLDTRATSGKFERYEFRRLIAGWDGRADPDSVSYELVREYHEVLLKRAWQMILIALDVRDEDGTPLVAAAVPLQFEGALWRLVTEEPAHLLPVSSASWRDFELEALDVTLDELAKRCRKLAVCRYGAVHPVAIRHPLSLALPGFIASGLDMPLRELPGDHDMPRVQDGAFGASERFAVAPGHEAEGYLELPGGPSGHPLSPYYASGFAAWAGGGAQPFLPGPAQHRLEIEPAPPNESRANPPMTR